MGGLKINADAEILDTQGNVIPGLYAAGETTGGTQSAGPYELRLPIFLQPLGGALKNRSAAPASPPCFRRRRTGCGTQHPLRLACVSLAAALSAWDMSLNDFGMGWAMGFDQPSAIMKSSAK